MIQQIRTLSHKSFELIDIVLASILFSLGVVLTTQSPHFATDNTQHLFMLLNISTHVSVFFAAIGGAQMLRCLLPKRVNYWIGEALTHSVNFCYTMISISLALKYPWSPHTLTYISLAVASFFSASRIDGAKR